MNRAAIAAGITALLIVGAFVYGQRLGRESVHAQMSQAVEEHRAKERELRSQLAAAREQREVIYRDRIHTIDRAIDPTGCLDEPIATDLLRLLPGADRLATGR